MPNPEFAQHEQGQVDVKTKFSKGFELLDGFEMNKQVEIVRQSGDAKKIEQHEDMARRIDLERADLEHGNPRPLKEHVASMIENNLKVFKNEVKGFGEIPPLSRQEIDNRIKTVRSLLDVLEQLNK